MRCATQYAAASTRPTSVSHAESCPQSRGQSVPPPRPGGANAPWGAKWAGKATRIDLFSLKTPQMRAFHLTWVAFFVCFFAWFATAPLMPTIAKDLSLTKDQVYNITIAGVFATILARMIIGPM